MHASDDLNLVILGNHMTFFFPLRPSLMLHLIVASIVVSYNSLSHPFLFPCQVLHIYIYILLQQARRRIWLSPSGGVGSRPPFWDQFLTHPSCSLHQKKKYIVCSFVVMFYLFFCHASDVDLAHKVRSSSSSFSMLNWNK